MAQPPYARVKSPDEICGDNHIFLDTNFLIEYLFNKEEYYDEAHSLVMDPRHNFVIDSFQKRCIKSKNFGPQLNELAEEMEGRLKVVDSVEKRDFKPGKADDGLVFLHSDLVERIGYFSDRIVTSPKWVRDRIDAYKPPQFKAMNKDSFDGIDDEDIYRFMSAVRYNIPILISEDAHMKGISLITEVRRPIYETPELQIPYILHPSYVFCEQDGPRIDHLEIARELKNWYKGITRGKRGKGSPKKIEDNRPTLSDFVRTHETAHVSEC